MVADLPPDVSVLLIEHDMDLVFRFATRITVLVNGRVLAEGAPDEMARDPAVRSAYLGEAIMLTQTCLSFCGSKSSAPAMARRWCCSTSTSRSPKGARSRLLGRNGVGKTTLVNTIIGVTRRRGGRIALAGRDITLASPEQRAHAGIGWVPQERNIFKSLTVLEN
jgi:ABC-type branched-subunit amino acid transport system ATPase component